MSYSKEQQLKQKYEKKLKKAKQLPLSKLKKQVQALCNKYIRERDKDLSCISCQKPCAEGHAGHYISQGSSGVLRFNELNINKQCVACNVWKHGNLIEYRINLIKKIGIKNVEMLEDMRHDTWKWDREALEEMKQYYKEKLSNPEKA